MAGIKVKQRDITDCGAACMGSIAAHYKLKLPVSKIRQYAGTGQKGTNVYGLVKASEKLGFTAKGVKGGMDSIPKIPLPAIAHVIVKERLQHFVVIYRVTQKHITFMDPGDGQLHKYTVHDFEKIWTGVLVLLAPNEDFREKNEKVSVFSRFLFLLKPHRSILTQTLFGAVIYTLLGLSTSFYIQKITDFVLIDGNKNLLNLLGVFMLIILLLQLFIQVIKSVFILKTGQKIDARLILGYYKHLLKLPQRFFDTMRVGEIISRVNDAVKIRAFINDTAIGLIVNFFIVVFAFLLMFLYNWKLAFIITLVLPLYALVYFITNRLNKKQERKLMEKAADLESQLVESLNSVRTIKSFGLEGFANTKTEVKFISLLQTIYKSGQNSIFSASSSEFLSRFFTIILLWTGAYFVLNNTLTPGELLSFYALIGYFTGPATSLITMNKTMQNALIAADRLFEIMDLERDESEEEKIHLTKEILGDIRFENVNFTYGTRVDVFENFSLVIPRGKITAIIGESGSGKTTLASLLQKLYPLNGGNISIGNYNLNYLSMNSLMEVIGIVPQKIDLFAGNVLENIAIGDFHPDMKKIVDICSKLGILDFIEKLPAGFSTYLGENGATLSGGQKQRIAIARVLYKEPEVLILDEATSNLDSASEEYIQHTIRELKNRGKTILIIAHRLSTVVHADQIVVLEEGKVVEKGVHKDLMEQEGKYFHLWKKQIPDFIYA